MTLNRTREYIEHIVYFAELIIVFAIQQDPRLSPEIFGGRPLILLPAFISVCVFEGKYSAMVFGIISGILLDFGFNDVIGIHVVLLCAAGYMIGMFSEKFIHINMVVYMLFVLLMVFIIYGSRFVLFYLIKGFGSEGYVLVHRLLPGAVYTMAIAPVFYLFNRSAAFFVGGRDSA